MTSTISDLACNPILFGASVVGPAHKRESLPNQDAWVKAQGPFGALIVVCDGLGSRPNSASGSRLACSAVRQAARRWPGKATGAEPAQLVRLIEAAWRLSVPPLDPASCATTCRFALREPDGTLILAALGDGTTLVSEGLGELLVLDGQDPSGFGNDTLGLGIRHQLKDWRIEVLEPAPGRALVLATDGIADDLEPDRLGGFVDYLVQDLALLASRERSGLLVRELRRWPVPRHGDDKTLAVMIEKERLQQ